MNEHRRDLLNPQTHVGIAKMMIDVHAPGDTGEPDGNFLPMRILRPKSAIYMARRVRQHGDDPITRKAGCGYYRQSARRNRTHAAPPEQREASRKPSRSGQVSCAWRHVRITGTLTEA